MHKPSRQHRTHVQLLANVARVHLAALIFRNYRRWSDYQRAHARQFGNDCIGKRELVKAGGGIVTQIAEAENRETLFFLISDRCEWSFVNSRSGWRRSRRGSGINFPAF